MDIDKLLITTYFVNKTAPLNQHKHKISIEKEL